jgi:hypothetical protein
VQTRRLNKDDFKATTTPKMHDVTKSATDVLDIWPYVQLVPLADLEGHAIYYQFIECVYRSDDDRFDHVSVMTLTKNVYLVVIVDLVHGSFHGHRLLDLNKEYGLS